MYLITEVFCQKEVYRLQTNGIMVGINQAEIIVTLHCVYLDINYAGSLIDIKIGEGL